jgi:hypothetical protein
MATSIIFHRPLLRWIGSIGLNNTATPIQIAMQAYIILGIVYSFLARIKVIMLTIIPIKTEYLRKI